MKCTFCGVELISKGYTVTMRLKHGQSRDWYMEERFCSEKCGLEFAGQAREILDNSLIEGGGDNGRAG